MNIFTIFKDDFLYTQSDLVITFLLLGLTLYASYRLYTLIKNFNHE